MIRQWKLVLALLLPVVALAAGIARNELALASAQTWVIPVEGYDPRDLLRGHYIQFRYRWQVEGDRSQCDGGDCLICLERRGEEVAARVMSRGEASACASLVDPRASNIGAGFTARIYVSEASAPLLEEALRSGPMAVVARLRPDGILVNERLQPLE